MACTLSAHTKYNKTLSRCTAETIKPQIELVAPAMANPIFFFYFLNQYNKCLKMMNSE